MTTITEQGLVAAHRVAVAFFLRLLDKAFVTGPFSNAFILRIDPCSAVFWWDDQTPLFEFPIIWSPGQVRSGYILVGTRKDLPPVLEYSLEGQGLADSIHRKLATDLGGLVHNDVRSRIYYSSPLDIYVRLSGIQDRDLILRLPDFRSSWVDAKASFIKPPARDPKNLSATKQSWRNLDELLKLLVDFVPGQDLETPRQMKPIIISDPRRVVSPRRPVKYSQNFDNYVGCNPLAAILEGKIACHPSCISGCAPVAWVMLLSAYRRGADVGWPPRQDQRLAKIFAGEKPEPKKGWWVDWPSWAMPNPSMSDVVSNFMWDLHRYMHTDCEGSTLWGGRLGDLYLCTRPRQWITRQYGEILAMRQMPYESQFAWYKKFMIDMKQPVLICGEADWQLTLKLLGIESPKLAGGRGGHCVVAYGCDSINEMVLICLGWGSFFQDKWISPYWASPRAAYVADNAP
jgi:hypothetical protein